MDCQRCGKRDALIHLTEINDGQVSSLWLCPECARERQSPDREDSSGGEPLFQSYGSGPGPFAPDEEDTLAAFLGEEGIRPRNVDPEGVSECPECEFRLETFFRLNRLGCPECFRAFEPNLRPVLARLHGRTIHLGKVPRTSPPGRNPLAEMTRTRVALEKAVAAENFEEAARLRDYLKMLQAARDREADSS
jgi:protein arginine kinase activator